MTKRQAARAVIFLLLVIIVLSSLTNLLRDRETTLSSFYSEPDNSIEAIIVGSSHVNATYVPAILWKEYNISAHNVFSWSQPMWVSYHYIVEALKTQAPKVIVMELYGMMYGNSYIMPEEIDKTNYANSFSISPSLNRLKMLDTARTCGLDLRNPVDFFNIVRYHSRWKYINEHSFNFSAHEQQSYLKGYGFLTNTMEIPVQPLAYENITDTLAPYEKSIEYLDKIVALAQKENIKLVFTLSPYEYNEQEVRIYNYLESYASQHNIPFINYNTTARSEAGFNFTSDLADMGHTNYSGAEKITRHLGNFLAQNYSFGLPESLPNTHMLTQDAGKMYRTVKVAAWLEEVNTLSFLQKAAEDDDITLYLIASSENMNSLAPEIQTALADLSLANFTNANLPSKSYYAGSNAKNKTGAWGETAAEVLSAPNGSNITLTANPEAMEINLNGNIYSQPSCVQWLYYDSILERPVAYGYFTNEDGTQMLLQEFLSK